MRAIHDEFLTLRLPRELRADLAAAAKAEPRGLSTVVRRALAAGLVAIRGEAAGRPAHLAEAR